jgi:hypothetical protein
MYLQHPMKSDVYTTPHEEVVNKPLFMGSCKYITLHGELLLHHSSWGVVNTPFFMGSCKYITLHGLL